MSVAVINYAWEPRAMPRAAAMALSAPTGVIVRPDPIAQEFLFRLRADFFNDAVLS
jgi:hypothetical protein